LTKVNDDEENTIQHCQYLLMHNRFMHELKTSVVDKAVQLMEKDDDLTKTITMTELGQSVLTLTEVLQTFEVDSTLFNIKLGECLRTVVLKKNKVEIDGKNKVIIMIRDVSDKIRIEKE
jgi:hypothetical protein